MLNQMAKRSRGGQLEFVFRPRGGFRKGAGRKVRVERVGLMPHVVRPRHSLHVPVHITARAVRGVPSLRSELIFKALRRIFARASEKGFRLLHFSVQGNHVHMIVEADDDVALARGVQRLLSRVAMTVNALSRRSGKLWGDRHHRRPLNTPTEVRNAYVYVLFNFRKHQIVAGSPGWELALTAYDPCSSYVWFDGWGTSAGPSEAAAARAGPPIVAPAESWLARSGWRPLGLVRSDEVPRS
jgi:REP element-mobilizing transposase RayT